MNQKEQRNAAMLLHDLTDTQLMQLYAGSIQTFTTIGRKGSDTQEIDLMLKEMRYRGIVPSIEVVFRRGK